MPQNGTEFWQIKPRPQLMGGETVAKGVYTADMGKPGPFSRSVKYILSGAFTESFVGCHFTEE